MQKSLAEGFGLTVAEAMWKSRPIVASAVGGIPTRSSDERHGLLIEDPRDLAAFGGAVERLLSDRDLAAAARRERPASGPPRSSSATATSSSTGRSSPGRPPGRKPQSPWAVAPDARPRVVAEGVCVDLVGQYALLSAIAGVPLAQGIAVTGSLNQRGELQAIGGVNQKIEGFHQACRLSGLTGTQGVIIPQANACNLMLAAAATKRPRREVSAMSASATGRAYRTRPGRACSGGLVHARCAGDDRVGADRHGRRAVR